MELSGSKRDELILNLKPEDYYQGPDTNQDDSEEGDVWMFGIGIKKRGKRKKIPMKCFFLIKPNYEKSVYRW